MLGNNAWKCVSFMFDEIRYELNGTEINCNINVGMTNLMKGYASYSGDFAYYMENTGFPRCLIKS